MYRSATQHQLWIKKHLLAYSSNLRIAIISSLMVFPKYSATTLRFLPPKMASKLWYYRTSEVCRKKNPFIIMIIWKIGLKLSIWTLVSITDFFLTGATNKSHFFKGLSTADRFRICFPHSRFSYLAPKCAKKTKFIECTSSTMKLIVSKMTVKFPWIFE